MYAVKMSNLNVMEDALFMLATFVLVFFSDALDLNLNFTLD